MSLRRAVACAGLAIAAASSCGPFLPEAVFTPARQPWIPLDRFAAGRLGVIAPELRERYLVIAYRALSGHPVALEPDRPVRPAETPPVNRWELSARALRPDHAIVFIGTDRRVPGEPWQTYQNCLDDAFSNATETLEDRLRRFGREAALKWLRAQDTVFQNCSEGRHIPDPPEPGLPALLRADREYQIATSYFYSEQFDKAREAFTRIAGDSESPWHDIAAYLIARSRLREGTLTNNRDALVQARAAFEKLGARGRPLIGYIDARLEPDQTLDEISRMLLVCAPAEFKQQLIDWEYLRSHGVKGTGELSRWIEAVRGPRPLPGTSLPALVTSMMHARTLDPKLERAAAGVKPTSPAYATVLYHRVRLLDPDAARALLDRSLPELRRSQPRSALNLFLGQRLALARNLIEFVRFAQRSRVDYDAVLPAGDEPLFDEDATRVMNRFLTVAQLAGVARSPELAESLRRQVLAAAWVRAAMLRDHARAVDLAADLAREYPALKHAFERYRKDRSDYSAALVMLAAPGLRPAVRAGFAREDPVTRINNIRDNWWCDLSGYHPFWSAPVSSPSQPPLPAFLSEADAAAAASEVERLDALGRAPNYLGEIVLRWASTHPDDRSVPEALHNVVRASRYGCTDKGTSAVSHAAFDLLHKRYPASEWSRKTPYWFAGP